MVMKNKVLEDMANEIMIAEKLNNHKEIAAILGVKENTFSNWMNKYKGSKFSKELIMFFYWYLWVVEKKQINDQESFIHKICEKGINVGEYLKNHDDVLEKARQEFNERYNKYKNSLVANNRNLQDLDDNQKEKPENNTQETVEEEFAEDSREEEQEGLIQEEIEEETEDNIQKAGQQFADDNQEEGKELRNDIIKYDLGKKDLQKLAEMKEKEITDLLDKRRKLSSSNPKKSLKEIEKKIQATIDEEIKILETLAGHYNDPEALYGLAVIYNSKIYQNANKEDYFKWLLKCAETFNFRDSVEKAENRDMDVALGALKECGDYYLNNVSASSVEGKILKSAFKYISYYIAVKTKYYPCIPIEEGGFSIQPYIGKSINTKDDIISKYKYKEQYVKSLTELEKKSIYENIKCRKLLNVINKEIGKTQ